MLFSIKLLKGLLLLPGGLLFVVLVFWSFFIAFGHWKTIRMRLIFMFPRAPSSQVRRLINDLSQKLN